MAISTPTTSGQVLTSAYVNNNINSGLVYITETTFTASSAVSLNSIFSATYQNYKIELFVSTATAQVTLNYKYRVSSADNSTANYGNQYLIADSTTVAAARTTGQTTGDIGTLTLSDISFYDITVFNPFTAAKKGMLVTGGAFGGEAYMRNQVNTFKASTSFDGISFIPSSGTITGTVRIYGYRQA